MCAMVRAFALGAKTVSTNTARLTRSELFSSSWPLLSPKIYFSSMILGYYLACY